MKCKSISSETLATSLLTKEEDTESDIHSYISSNPSQSDQLALIKAMKPPTWEAIKSRRVKLGEKTRKYTLFLDLDETLVYSRGHSLKRSISDSKYLEVTIRPYTQELLEMASALYEIVIFSAGSKDYVLNVVDLIDPHRKYIKKVLHREHCIPVGKDCFVKDLRIIEDRLMEEMLIVDNSILSFAFQLANGVCVDSYFGEEDDKELGYLNTYLSDLYTKEDIVKINGENMGLLS